jgi:molybdopterin molybdotransferase
LLTLNCCRVKEEVRMSRRTGALEVEQALETALRYCRVTEPETCPIGDCADRILAEDMRAAVNSPPFRRSAMDGFAVRSEDLWGASERRPVVLTVRGCNDAGSPVIRHIGKGEAAQIMTGGVLPEEADAVVKQEIVELRGQDTAVFSAPSKPGDCFSPIGEDLQEGEILAHAGETVDASALAAGAAAGLSMLSVRKQVRSAVICTGDELTLPGKPLGEGKIYGSSHLYLTTRLRQCGCADAKAYFAGDDPSGIAKMIRRQIEKGAQLIVTTGGVSVGRKDYLPAVIDMIGGEILFHGIDIKPGMPSMLSKAGETLILSLSGNPYSCACIFELIGRPVIAAMLGKQCVRDKVLQIPSADSYNKRSPVRRILRGRFDGVCVHFSSRQRNGQMAAGIGCNCLIDIPAGNEGIREGDNVRVILLNNTL